MRIFKNGRRVSWLGVGSGYIFFFLLHFFPWWQWQLKQIQISFISVFSSNFFPLICDKNVHGTVWWTECKKVTYVKNTLAGKIIADFLKSVHRSVHRFYNECATVNGFPRMKLEWNPCRWPQLLRIRFMVLWSPYVCFMADTKILASVLCFEYVKPKHLLNLLNFCFRFFLI